MQNHLAPILCLEESTNFWPFQSLSPDKQIVMVQNYVDKKLSLLFYIFMSFHPISTLAHCSNTLGSDISNLLSHIVTPNVGTEIYGFCL